MRQTRFGSPSNLSNTDPSETHPKALRLSSGSARESFADRATSPSPHAISFRFSITTTLSFRQATSPPVCCSISRRTGRTLKHCLFIAGMLRAGYRTMLRSDDPDSPIFQEHRGGNGRAETDEWRHIAPPRRARFLTLALRRHSMYANVSIAFF